MEAIGKTLHLQFLELGEVEKSGWRQPQEAGFGSAVLKSIFLGLQV